MLFGRKFLSGQENSLRHHPFRHAVLFSSPGNRGHPMVRPSTSGESRQMEPSRSTPSSGLRGCKVLAISCWPALNSTEGESRGEEGGPSVFQQTLRFEGGAPFGVQELISSAHSGPGKNSLDSRWSEDTEWPLGFRERLGLPLGRLKRHELVDCHERDAAEQQPPWTEPIEPESTGAAPGLFILECRYVLTWAERENESKP